MFSVAMAETRHALFLLLSMSAPARRHRIQLREEGAHVSSAFSVMSLCHPVMTARLDAGLFDGYFRSHSPQGACGE
jgi:hypothetical protein